MLTTCIHIRKELGKGLHSFALCFSGNFSLKRQYDSMFSQSLLTFKYIYSNFLLTKYTTYFKIHSIKHTNCPDVDILKVYIYMYIQNTLFSYPFAAQRMFLFSGYSFFQRTCYPSKRAEKLCWRRLPHWLCATMNNDQLLFLRFKFWG